MFAKPSPYMKKRRYELKRNMTPQEKALYYGIFKTLREKKIADFTHQEIINDEYIVDFCCDKLMLVVEIDGSQHRSEEGEKEDRIRTARLNELGLKVVRYDNKMIDENYDGVCSDILRQMQERAEELDVPINWFGMDH